MSSNKRMIRRNTTDLWNVAQCFMLAEVNYFFSCPITNLIVGQYNKCTAARRLNNYSDELWVHRRERRVPATFRYADIIVALLTF
jgi:hypothetical protein